MGEMGKPLGYLLTWTTYGTWLSGDRRKWVSRKDSGANVPYKAPASHLQATMKPLMKESSVRFSCDAKAIVRRSIEKSCEVKNWALHALAVQSNHVHVVLTVYESSPDDVMKRLKAYASRAMNAELGRRKRWWTRHGSTRYLTTPQSMQRAVEYVENQ